MVRSKLSVKLIGDKKRRRNTFVKRRSGLQNKARELSILCDIPVLLVCVNGPEEGGRQHELIWPPEPAEAYAIAARFRSASAEDRSKHTYDVSSFFGDAVMMRAVLEEEGAKEVEEGEVVEEEGRGPARRLLLDLMPESSLQGLEQALEARLGEIEQRMATLRRGDLRRADHEDASDQPWPPAQPHDQEGRTPPAQQYETRSNPPGDEILRGLFDGHWGNPTGGGFDVDATSTGFEVAPPPRTYPSYPDDDEGYSALSCLNSPNMVHSSPAPIMPMAFLPPMSTGAAFSDYGGAGDGSALQPCATEFHPFQYCQFNAAAAAAAASGWCGCGGAMEQAAGESNNNGDEDLCCLGDLYGGGLGLLPDEPIEEVPEETPWCHHSYPAIAFAPLAGADGRWGGLSGS